MGRQARQPRFESPLTKPRSRVPVHRPRQCLGLLRLRAIIADKEVHNVRCDQNPKTNESTNEPQKICGPLRGACNPPASPRYGPDFAPPYSQNDCIFSALAANTDSLTDSDRHDVQSPEPQLQTKVGYWVAKTSCSPRRGRYPLPGSRTSCSFFERVRGFHFVKFPFLLVRRLS